MPALALLAALVLGFDVLVVADDFGDHEGEEFLSKIRVETGLFGEGPQAGNLTSLTGRISGWQFVEGFNVADTLSAAEAFSEDMDEGRVNIVNRLARSGELWGDVKTGRIRRPMIGTIRFVPRFTHGFSPVHLSPPLRQSECRRLAARRVQAPLFPQHTRG